jgi:phage major head subunit gpT-like protein
MGGLGLINQFAEGDAPTFDAGVEAWLQTYTHLQWGLGFKVTQIAQEDELYGVYARFATELARATLYTQEIQAMGTFNNLGATAYTANATAFPLLSTAQYRIDDGTWSNKLASGADLSIESLELALSQWRTGMVDLRGRKLATEPRVLMVGPSDRWVAERIVNSTQRPFTANNDDNVVRNLGLDVLVMTHLTDDGRWFLLGEKEMTGLNWFNRRNIQMQRQTAGDGSNNIVQ